MGHFDGDGDLANSCPVKKCANDCPKGQWRAKCDQTTSPGECVPCTKMLLSPCYSNGAGGEYAYIKGSQPREIAKAACESRYGKGKCAQGLCGSYRYYFGVGAKTCSCSKPVGSTEYVFEIVAKDIPFGKNSADYLAGEDYADVSNKLSSDTTTFIRRKITDSCNSQAWEIVEENFGTKNALTKTTCDGNYVTSNAFITDSCSQELCNVDCPIGQYNRGCTEFSAGECTPCKALLPGMYWTGDGDLADACPVAKCDKTRCKFGEKLVGCGGTSAGECQACAQPSFGSLFDKDAALSSCGVRACRSDCGAGNKLTGRCTPFQASS